MRDEPGGRQANGSPPPSRQETAVTWVLRGVVIATALIHMVGGDPVYGLYCLAAVALASVPALLARSLRAALPVEIEIVLLWALAADMTLGHLAGLYAAISWFDKALHLGTSILLGILAFQAVYVAHFIGHSRRHPWIDGAAILLLTLGLGALWEIGEFAADRSFGRATQGAPGLHPLDDTMWDLVLDGAGGLLGAILGPLYMRWSDRSRARMDEFASLLRGREQRALGRARRRRERRATRRSKRAARTRWA